MNETAAKQEYSDYMTPFLAFTLMSNGIDVAQQNAALQVQGGYNRFDLNVLGTHPRWNSSATRFDLGFIDTQWLKKPSGLLLTKAALNIDGYPCGYATPFVIDVNEHANGAPGGILHWMKDCPVAERGDWDKIAGYERFSLMVTRNQVA